MSDNKNSFDLSIIVPCHNSGLFIAPLLYSLKRQKIDPYKVEIIFVLDNTDDNTLDLIKTYSVDIQAQIHGIVGKFGSAGASRNQGLDNAVGEYIWFMDSDDWLIDDLAIYKGLTLAKMNKHDNRIIKFDYDCPKTFTSKHTNSVVWQYVIKRDLIGDLRFQSSNLNEDVYFLQELFKKFSEGIESPYLTYTDEQYYFYNFGRFNSITQERFANNPNLRLAKSEN